MIQPTNLLDQAAQLQQALRDHVAQARPQNLWRYSAVAQHYQKVANARQSGHQLAYINFASIPELFWAMDIVPVSADAVTTFSTSTPQGALGYIDAAEEYLPDYLCSSNKIAFGAMLKGDLPKPDMIVTPSAPCDAPLASYAMLAHHMDVPYFSMDIPYLRNDRGHEYLKDELKRLVAFLEERTQRKLDIVKLREVMHYSIDAHGYIPQIKKLLANVPCPMRSIEITSDFGVVSILAGTSDLVDFLKHRYEETRQMVDMKRGALPEEKLRLLWIYVMPVYDWSLFSWLEKQYGAVSIGALNIFEVGESYEKADLTTMDGMLSALAAKTIKMPMLRECGGPWEYYIDRMVELCRDLHPHAAVFGGHIACKNTWAIAKLIKDRLRNELGVQTLSIEMDVFDPRIATLDSIKSQLAEFIEVYSERRKQKA